ncbi:MAG: hypothetical protein LH480_02090, partial [Rubrivivax sp.]|nr:hypothetical protein [Rubrivivax sp.]
MSTLNNLVEGVASPLRQLQRMDDRRPSLPGEHWAALGTGLTVLGWARRRGWPLVRAGARAAGRG